MKRSITIALVLAVLLAGAVAPAAAAQTNGTDVDECKNADKGPSGEEGPPGFVGGLVPDFLGDMFSDLPVPGFLKGWTGAEGC